MKIMLLALMRLGRRLFRNTPIQQLRITTFVYKKIALRVFGVNPVEVEFRGAKFLYPGGDYTTLPTLKDGTYESAELDNLLRFLDEQTKQIVAIDIGANVGIWTVLLARHSKVLKVISLEPGPSNLAFLRHNIDANGVEQKVQIIEAAVSNKSGVAAFNIDTNGATMRLDDRGSLMVPTVVVDDIAEDETIGVLKIDVEGFEADVLEGSWKTIERDFPNLYVEYSLPQAKSAGKSWDHVGPKLLNLYGKINVISDKKVSTIIDFDELSNDHRLLTLQMKK